MITVTIAIDIRHPAQRTFDFIANPENNPQWQKGMKQCTITSEGPWGVGSEYRQVAEFMGKPVITTFRITRFEPGHHIKGESIQSTFPITFTRIVEGDENISHVQAIITGAPKGLMGMLPFLTRWMIRSTISRDYKRLQALLENSGS